MRKIKGQIDFTFEDSEGYNPTGLMGELVFSMDYIYTPGEEMVRYYKDGSGHPGTPPEIEYENIQFRWIDEGMKHKHLPVEQMLAIQNWFVEQLNRSDSIKDMVDTIVEKEVADREEL